MTLATAFIASYTSRVTGWYVMTDELQHVKLSLSIWEELSLAPRVRGAEIQAYSQLYPLLTAPFFGLLDMPAGFDAVHHPECASDGE